MHDSNHFIDLIFFSVLQQLLDLALGQAQQIDEIEHGLGDVQASGSLRLDLALGLPGDAEAGRLQHGDVVGAVADGDGLVEAEVFAGAEGEEEVAFVLGVDDGVGGVELAGEGVGDWVGEEVVGEGVVEAELGGEPVGQGLEAAAEDGEGEAETFEHLAEFFGARGDGDLGFESLEDVAWNAFQEGHSGFEAGGEVELAVHGAGGDCRHFGLNADVGCDLVDDFLLDEGGVHVEDAEALVTAENAFRLEDNFAVPFSFETIDGFVFAQVSEAEVYGVGRWGEADFRYSRLGE
jgi:hypothetical protein